MKRPFHGPLLLRHSPTGEPIQFYQPMDQIVMSSFSLEHSPVLKIKPVFFWNKPLTKRDQPQQLGSQTSTHALHVSRAFTYDKSISRAWRGPAPWQKRICIKMNRPFATRQQILFDALPKTSWIKLFCRKFIMVNIICCSLHGVDFYHMSGLLRTGCPDGFGQLFLPCGISSERVWIRDGSAVRRLHLPLALKLAVSQNNIVDNVKALVI